MSVWGTRLTEKLISACVQPAGRAGPPAAAPAAASASEAIETLRSVFHTPRSSSPGVRRPSGSCKGNVKRRQRPPPRAAALLDEREHLEHRQVHRDQDD